MEPRPLPKRDVQETPTPDLKVLPGAGELDTPDVEEREELAGKTDDGTPLSDPLKLYVRQIGDGRLLT
ncbi:MAG TPA: hypothetical protein VFM13_09205, partial [Gaiellaceae bacterium]|nr:hypothetical protein [Gaiellaceae bacterium]